MKSIIDFLKETLVEGTEINGYHFVKWIKKDSLQYQINKDQKKSIPSDLLNSAFKFHIENPNSKITYRWVKENKHDNWCTPKIINAILTMYDKYITTNV